jgi:SEC-C motif domain protein
MNTSPSELIRARCRAFAEGDFYFIHDSYHDASFFRRQFPDREEYVRNGRSSLSKEFEIRECRILKEEILVDQARVIYYLDTLSQGRRVETFELSIFKMTRNGWRYFATQKMDRHEFAGEIDSIDWQDFERIKEKFFF